MLHIESVLTGPGQDGTVMVTPFSEGLEGIQRTKLAGVALRSKIFEAANGGLVKFAPELNREVNSNQSERNLILQNTMYLVILPRKFLTSFAL